MYSIFHHLVFFIYNDNDNDTQNTRVSLRIKRYV